MRSGTVGRVEIHHPAVLALYLASALVLCMCAFHPVLVGISLVSGLVLGVCLRGWRAVGRGLRWQLPFVMLVALVNPFFSASGSTELMHIGLHAIYLESLVYGACMGAMLVAAMLWCSNAAAVLTDDQVLGLLGNLMPVVALMLSMVMRLVPRLMHRAGEASNAVRACTAVRAGTVERRNGGTVPTLPQPSSGSMGRGAGTGNRPPYHSGPSRAANARLRLVTVLMAWSMEDSLQTADAMRARGWGAGERRTAYRQRVLRGRDVVELVVLVACVIPCAVVIHVARAAFPFYPRFDTLVPWWTYLPYALFMFLPCSIVVAEESRWS